MRSLVFLLALWGCATPKNPYELAKPHEVKNFKQVMLPLRSGTPFKVSQGAFGQASHWEKGNEMSWDLEVPLGTEVIAVESGRVIEIWNPDHGGGCDPKYMDFAHNVQIEAKDGTVAQYVHIKTFLRMNQKVEAGQTIGVTALNGFICTPQLHFGIYRSREQTYDSFNRETLPLRFKGIKGELLMEGKSYTVPEL